MLAIASEEESISSRRYGYPHPEPLKLTTTAFPVPAGVGIDVTPAGYRRSMPSAAWSATARWNRERQVIYVTIVNEGPSESVGPFEVYSTGDRRHVSQVVVGESGPTTSLSDPFAKIKMVTVELAANGARRQVLQVPVR